MTRKAKDWPDKIVNAVLFPFGRCRIKLGEWPANGLAPVLDGIKQRGGVLVGEGGMATAVDEYYFRTPQGRVTLSVFEYGPTYLWGPKKLVRELSKNLS